MQGDDAEAGGLVEKVGANSLFRQRRRWRHRFLPVAEQRIDHDVAGEVNALGGNALASEVVLGRALGRIEQVRDLVGHEAIDFLGHVAIEAAQPAFDVHDGRALLDGDQAARQRRIDVTDDDDAARRQLVDAPARNGA